MDLESFTPAERELLKKMEHVTGPLHGPERWLSFAEIFTLGVLAAGLLALIGWLRYLAAVVALVGLIGEYLIWRAAQRSQDAEQ